MFVLAQMFVILTSEVIPTPSSPSTVPRAKVVGIHDMELIELLGVLGNVSVFLELIPSGDRSNTVYFQFNPPVIDDVQPATGVSTRGGSLLTIFGYNFGQSSVSPDANT